MFTRRREQIIVLLGLLALNGGLAWLLSHYWRDYHTRVQWIYARRPSEAEAASASPRVPAGETYTAIVDHNLFRPDRANVGPAEAPKMPDLPLLYGTMNLGAGTFAMMATADQTNGTSKPVHVGEEIGGFKLVSIADSQVVVGWGEKRFTVNVWESARRVPRVVDRTGATPAAAPAATQSAAVAGAPRTAGATAVPVVAGNDQQKTGFVGFYAPPGAPADAPVGTVFGGKRKEAVQTMFGTTYRWVDAGPAQSNTPPPQ